MMGKLIKMYDETFNKGAHSDDSLDEIGRIIAGVSHKPTQNESKLVNGDIGDMSYYSILDKKIRIVLYIED